MDRYAVIGNPISHSKSPFIHMLFARQTQQHLTYEAIELPEGGFSEGISQLFGQGLSGCNVTVPFKQDAFNYAYQLSPRAELAGAVNTLKKTDDGLILGDNTDGAGLLADLKNHIGELAGLRVAILGAGGAARGVVGPLLEANPAHLVIANRTFEKAHTLAERFSALGSVSACQLSELDDSFDLVINATSASLAGQNVELPEVMIHSNLYCYDMMYSNKLTPFNQWAKELGAYRVFDGLGMLVAQAAESFALWRGLRPGTRQVIFELRRNLSC